MATTTCRFARLGAIHVPAECPECNPTGWRAEPQPEPEARTDLGVATLHGYDPETGTTSTDVFTEREGIRDSPWHRAHALKASVADDFPGRIWTVGQNRRSKYLMYAQNMFSLGLDPEPYEEWTDA